MKLFTRDVVLQGPPAEVRAWATSIAARYTEVTGNAVDVWANLAGGTTGHVSWTMTVEGAATIMEASPKVLADAGYLTKLGEGRDFVTGPGVDRMYRPYNGELGGEGGAPGNVAVVTSATARAGSLGEAVAWGMESAGYVSELTGIPTLLLGTVAGGFSDLLWVGVAEDAAAADAAMDAWSADEGYRDLLRKGGDHFVDGSALTQLFQRIG